MIPNLGGHNFKKYYKIAILGQEETLFMNLLAYYSEINLLLDSTKPLALDIITC